MKSTKYASLVIALWKPQVCMIVGLLICAAASLQGASNSSVEPRQRHIVKSKLRNADCGAASLYLISKLTNKPSSLDYIKQITNTTLLGTNMSDLKKGAQNLGFHVEAAVCSFDKLCIHLQNPDTYAIIYSVKGHYVVAIGLASAQCVRIVDVGRGVFDLPGTELIGDYKWGGATLLLSHTQG